jgi:hypothetical protein
MMTRDTSTGKSTRVDVGGALSGQLVVGDNNQLLQTSVAGPPVTEAERKQLERAFADLRAKVEQAAPAERRQAGQERITELQEAVMADKPDLTTIEYVRTWFVRNLPSVAGAVVSIVVHPIVGKLVAAAGDALVVEFDRRLGSSG